MTGRPGSTGATGGFSFHCVGMNVLPACDSTCYMQKARRFALPQVNILLEMLPTPTTEADEERKWKMKAKAALSKYSKCELQIEICIETIFESKL